jgi:hypothetical protein
MYALLWLALFLAPPARAGDSAVPVATPAAAPAVLVAVTPELLQRWGYDVDKVMALPPNKRAELQKDLTLLEIGRLRRLQILKQIKPSDWRTYVTEQELLTPEGMKLIDDYLAKMKDKPMLVPAQIKDFERADGKPLTAEDFARAQVLLDHMFDGVAAHTGKDMSGEVVVDAHVRNETVYDMTITNPKTGLSLSVGQLFVDQEHPQAEASPYANITWNKDSQPESWVDYRFKASLGYVDLRSRWFSDGPSPQVGQALSTAQSLGVPSNMIGQASKYLTYDDPYQAHGIIVSSLLSELGRAYNLYGPVDIAWTVGNLTKTMWVAPNTAFDETLGLRVRLNNGMSLGIFGGATQNVSPVGTQLLQQAMQTGTIQAGVNVENAPHASVALWGKVPGASDLYFSVAGTQRWNNETQVHEVEGSLMTTFWKHPVSLKGSYSRESGTAIEYGRQKAGVEVDVKVAPNADAFLGYQRDHVTYGNATVNSDAVMLGFKIDFGGGGSSLTVDQLFGGQYKDVSPALKSQLQGTLTQIQQNLTNALNIVNQANQAYDNLGPNANPAQLEKDLNNLSLALSRLDANATSQVLDQLNKSQLTPSQKAALSNIWLRTVSPNSSNFTNLNNQLSHWAAGPQGQQTIQKMDNWSQWFNEHQGDIRRAIALLGNEQFWDAAVVNAARAEFITAMKQYGKVNVPILGHDFTLQIDPPAIMAAAGILNSRLSPVAPLTPAQADTWLMSEAGKELGLGQANPTQAQVAAGVFALADAQMKQQLTALVTPLINELGNLNGQQLASKILTSVPPSIAAVLKQQYGPNLGGLINPSMTAPQLKNVLSNLPSQAVGLLESKYGPQVAQGIGAAVGWAGELLAREVNMTLIQTMLASEELDRLTVDHGRKIDDLDLHMAMRSFDMLDERGQHKSMDHVRDMKDQLIHQAGADEARLRDKFVVSGKAALQQLQLDPAWPQGLRVQVDDDAWMPLLTLYGDGNFYALVDRIKNQYTAKPHPQGLTINFTYRADSPFGTSIWRDPKTNSIKFELGPPKNPRDAAFRLENLDGYVNEK